MVKCIHCNKQYVNPNNFKKHYLICNILNSNTHKNETIDINNMSIIVRKLVKDNKEQQKKIKLLERKINMNKKINLMKYLNIHVKPSTSFYKCFNIIKIDKKLLNTIIKLKFVRGIVYILKRYIENIDEDELTLRGFYEKKYLIEYNGKEWIKLEMETLGNIILIIQRQFMNFRETLFDNDEETYLAMGNLVYGGFNRENSIKEIYDQLYNSIKIRARKFINNRYIIE